MSELQDSKMLPQILKTVQECGQQVITTEGLLERIRQNWSKSETELLSQFNLALAEGQRTGLVSVKSGRVKSLFTMTDQPSEPRNFSCHLMLLSDDLEPSASGSSRGGPVVDAAAEYEAEANDEEGEDVEEDDDDGQDEGMEPCDCQEHAPSTRNLRSSGSSTHWLRPRNDDITYDEMKLIRQVFNRKELGPEWNKKRRNTVPGTSQVAASETGGRRSRRSTLARMPTKSRSRGRRQTAPAARMQASRSRSSRSRTRGRP